MPEQPTAEGLANSVDALLRTVSLHSLLGVASRASDPRIELLCRTISSDSSRAELHAGAAAAAALNMSLSRFQHLFKQQIGIPFARFVKLVRLDRARSTLLCSRLSVKEIAVSGGFHDVSHFVRDFKTAYGESPAKLRLSQAESKRIAVSANT